jgi:hypothetical protein
MSVAHVFSTIFELVTAIITISIGIKFLITKEYFSYHKFVIGKEWTEIDEPIRKIFLAVFKMTSSGIIVLSLIMFYYIGINFFTNELSFISKIAFPLFFILFWIGSFLTTFNVYKKTNANTPWKGSIASIILLVLGLILGII